MADSFVFKTDRPWPNPRLYLGAIVGHTTATTARIWLRTAKPGDFELLVYDTARDEDNALYQRLQKVPLAPLDKLPKHVQRYPFTVADYADDTTTCIDVSGLAPRSVYRYALYGKDENRIMLGQDQQQGHRFRTLPDSDGKYSFAFFSCHMPYAKTPFGETEVVNMHMWDCMEEALARHTDKELSFIIAGGDQVYTDGVKTLSIWRYLNKIMRKQGNRLLPDKDSMLSWYRDIYRGYWGFPVVRRVYSRYPTYMIWDDHEFKDGWGSDYFQDADDKNDLKKILPDLKEKGMSDADGHKLIQRMGEAARQVYGEYQHCHNPHTARNVYDYTFEHGSSRYYVLDGRSQRDVNREDGYHILGKKQLKRFTDWLATLDPDEVKYLFVVSAVPVVHLSANVVDKDLVKLARSLGLSDDLRDAWEHPIHQQERQELMAALFAVARKGIRVSILSGDVHISAAFRIQDTQSSNVIYQLTSSAITYNIPRPLGWILSAGAADGGTTSDGYPYERVALYSHSNFSMVRVDPVNDRVVFQLYGEQEVASPDADELVRLPEEWQVRRPLSNSIAKIPLEF